MAEVSVFARMTGKNRHFRDLSQQVLSGVVARSILCLLVPLQLGALCSVFARAATNLTLSVLFTYPALS